MAIHDEICRSIDRFKDQAIGLGRQIHAHPELKFEERFAAGLLTGALGEMGVVVERGVAGLETAFRAEAGKSDRIRRRPSPSSPSTTRCPTATPAATISSAPPRSQLSPGWPLYARNCPDA